MIEVLNVDALDVSMFGDCFETLLWVRCRGRNWRRSWRRWFRRTPCWCMKPGAKSSWR